MKKVEHALIQSQSHADAFVGLITGGMCIVQQRRNMQSQSNTCLISSGEFLLSKLLPAVGPNKPHGEFPRFCVPKSPSLLA